MRRVMSTIDGVTQPINLMAYVESTGCVDRAHYSAMLSSPPNFSGNIALDPVLTDFAGSVELVPHGKSPKGSNSFFMGSLTLDGSGGAPLADIFLVSTRTASDKLPAWQILEQQSSTLIKEYTNSRFSGNKRV